MSKFIIINDGYCHENLTIWFIFLDRCQNHNNELNLKLKKRNLEIEIMLVFGWLLCLQIETIQGYLPL